jgi:hypothetical protein
MNAFYDFNGFNDSNGLNGLNGFGSRDFLQTDTESSNGVLELYQQIVDNTCKYSEIDFGTIIDV